jgi:hypothetical protein
MPIVNNYTSFRSVFTAALAPVSPDGFKYWYTEYLRLNGFDGGITGMPRPATAFPVALTCNGGIDDGGTLYRWYLSQRTDVLARQYLSIAQTAPLKSGSVTISLTALAVSELGLDSPTSQLSEENLISLLTHTWLYVCRYETDQAHQMLDLLKETLR